MKYSILIFFVFFLIACQSTNQASLTSIELHDEVFPDYALFPIETEEEVFMLDQAAMDFVDSAVNLTRDPYEQMEALVDKIFDRSELNLLYMGNANTVASETFHNRAANCLSLSIMTYSLAQYAGMGVRFQDVKIPEYWTRRDGYSLLNGHVNLRILPRNSDNVIHLLKHGVQVDFDPLVGRQNFTTRMVDRQTILAMFYNNLGADALLSNSYSKSYAYFRAAIKVEPDFDSSWVNLGILSRLNDHYELAEASYKQALAINSENLTAWENLAYLYELDNKPLLADEINARVESQRRDNPYHHFIMGEQEFEEHNWQAALQHYRDALRLDKSKHEIYFGLAKTYFELGDFIRSAMYMKKAKRFSRNNQDQQKYQGKLDFLSSSAANRS